MSKGIDVSSYQGLIDWTRVKPYIDFAIIRCGWGNNLLSQDDIYCERNTKLCEELNIPYGVYLYSYATTLDEARSEVEHTLRLIKDKKIEYPIYLDVESKGQMSLRKEELISIVKYYCNEIEKNGYYVGIYASLNTLNGILNSNELDPYDKWVAEWNSNLTYDKKCGMWQNSSYEEIPGIRNRVDSDISFYDFPKIIKDNNLNHLNDNTKYHIGNKLYLSGDTYEDKEATKIKETLCDKEITILEVFPLSICEYLTEYGYVKESSLYNKC